MGTHQKLRTVRQLANESPVFTEASLRWLIFQAETNGLDAALVRVGRRLYVDRDRFDEWLADKQSGR